MITKDKITNVLKKHIAENKIYVYYDQSMYPKWVSRDELIILITTELLNDTYNEEPLDS